MASYSPGSDDVTAVTGGDLERPAESSTVQTVHASGVAGCPGYVSLSGPLDMASLAQAVNQRDTGHLQTNSEVTIDFEAPRFVLTDAQDDVIEVLDDKGVAILTGPPGCGKSYQGQAVLRHYRDQGYTPYTLRSLTDWDSHVGPDTRSVVLLDGTLGRHRVNSAEYELWLAVRSTVIALTAQGHCKLVVTVYPHVLCTLQQLENGTRSPLLDPAVVVSLPGSMDRAVKTHLLLSHLKELNLPEDKQREVVEEVLHKDVSGPVFAWCCDWMVRHWHSSVHPTDIFTQPAEAYVPLLRRLLLDTECGETMAAVLALAMRGLGGFLHDPRRVQPDLTELRFQENVSDYRLEEHADLLKGFILAHDGYGFTSRVLYEAAGMALGRAYSVPVMLQVCDARFFINYVTTDPQAELVVIVGGKHSLWQLYEQRLQQMMAKNADGIQKTTALEELTMCLLFASPRQSIKQAAKSVLKMLVKTKGKLPERIQYRWPKAMFTSRSAQDSLSRLQTHLACYLDAPSKPIPGHLLSVSVQEDEVSVDLSGQHLYLVLRLLTDTERDEQDDDGNTIFHLAALAGLWNILTMAVKDSLMVSNKQRKNPVQLLKTKLQKSTLLGKKSVTTSDSLLFKSLEGLVKSPWAGCNNTALHWTMEDLNFDSDTANVRVLIQHGASVNEKNERGETALHMACKKYKGTDRDTVVELLQHGAEVNVKDNAGNTPLYLAEKSCSIETVRLLITHGANVNEKNEDGKTLLHKACIMIFYFGPDVRVLLQHGADVNVKDNAGNTPLYLAGRRGSIETVRLLLQHGASVNEKNEDGKTALHMACQVYNRLDAVHELLQHGADVIVKDNAGNTPLHLAGQMGYIEIVRLLIQHGASVNEKNVYGETALHKAFESVVIRELLEQGAGVNERDNAGNTPLHLAGQNCLAETVRLLIQYDASINEKNERGETSLHMACKKYRKLDVLGTLLQHGADVIVKDKAGNTPLHFAGHMGYTEIVRLLIQHGASVNEKNEDGETALHMACKMDNGPDAVNELLQHGADVNERDNAGNTPLHLAGQSANTKCVRLLIEHGASVNEKNEDGETALHMASKIYNGLNAIRDLLQHGADVNEKDNAGNTPLYLAVGYTEIVRLLIQHGASVNEKNEDGKTALHKACSRIEMFYFGLVVFRKLLQHGADVNVKDNAGNTPLHLAGKRGNIDIVSLLIQHGASVNEKNEDGETALHMACTTFNAYGSFIIRKLLHHGADVNVKDNAGNTPLHLAEQMSNTEIVQVLIQHGARVYQRGNSAQGELV